MRIGGGESITAFCSEAVNDVPPTPPPTDSPGEGGPVDADAVSAVRVEQTLILPDGYWVWSPDTYATPVTLPDLGAPYPLGLAFFGPAEAPPSDGWVTWSLTGPGWFSVNESDACDGEYHSPGEGWSIFGASDVAELTVQTDWGTATLRMRMDDPMSVPPVDDPVVDDPFVGPTCDGGPFLVDADTADVYVNGGYYGHTFSGSVAAGQYVVEIDYYDEWIADEIIYVSHCTSTTIIRD